MTSRMQYTLRGQRPSVTTVRCPPGSVIQRARPLSNMGAHRTNHLSQLVVELHVMLICDIISYECSEHVVHAFVPSVAALSPPSDPRPMLASSPSPADLFSATFRCFSNG